MRLEGSADAQAQGVGVGWGDDLHRRGPALVESGWHDQSGIPGDVERQEVAGHLVEP